MSIAYRFLKDTEGAITVEFVMLVPFFMFIMMFFVDTSLLYLTHSEMYNAARDVARRVATGELTTQAEVKNYALEHLHLGARNYEVVQTSGGVTVAIAIRLDEALIFGEFFQSVMGDALIIAATMQREPHLSAPS